MPAINAAYALLVYRYTVHKGLPASANPWDFFPLNNERFREVAGISSVTAGLSEPPTGRMGSSIAPTIKKLWVRKAAGAVKFLLHCDDQRRVMDSPPTMEAFQTDVLKVAPHHKDWEWVINHFFGAAGGLNDRLRELMGDHGCDAEEAYRQAREDRMSILGEDFREGKMLGATRFNEVWLAGRQGLGRALLGNLDGNGRVNASYFPTLRALCYRIFETTSRTLQKNVGRLDFLDVKLQDAYREANEKPTLKRIRAVTALYSTILSVHRGIGITGDAEKKTPWRCRIDQLWEGLGQKQSAGKTLKVPKKHPQAHLVSDEALETAWQEYRAEIWVPTQSGASAFEHDSVDDEQTDGPLEGINNFLLDVGVTKWSKKTTAEIKEMLGIPECGLPGCRRNANGTLSMEPMWHQWACVAEMIDRSFTEENDIGRPTLLADEVGMGKTAQSIVYIQVLWHLKTLQDTNPEWPKTNGSDGIQKWPEFLGNRKIFMGHRTIPALPSFIMAPTTLIQQWRNDLKNWLSDDACHTLTYRGNEDARKAFFEPGSPYSTAMGSNHPERTIVFVEAPSVLLEGRTELTEHGDLVQGQPSSGHPSMIAKSIFGKPHLVGILEEGHIYRNPGHNYRTTLTLMSTCAQRIILTATPVFTHPRDLLSLGRILQAPKFIGTPGASLTSNVEALFKKHAKNWDSEDEQQNLRQFLLSLRGSIAPEGSESTNTNTSQVIDPATEQESEMKSYRAFWSARVGLFMLRQAMNNIIIRRDDRSSDPDGKPLLGLHPLLNILSPLKLKQSTRDALKSQTATKEERNLARQNLDSFFTSLKKILVHPRLLERKSDSKIAPDLFVKNLFPTLESYQADPSEKIDRVLRLLGHHLGEDNAQAGPLTWDANGEECEDDSLSTDAPEKDKVMGRRKVVVYCHLSLSWALVAHILDLHGFKSVKVNGSMDPAQRDAAVQAFQSEEGPDVMLLSDVGAQGLNLQRGSIMVYIDNPWSGAETQQINGRLQRRGQTRQVLIYRLIAPDTPDEFLLGYASGKTLMMQVFTRECNTHGLPGFEHEDRDEEEFELDEEPPKTSRARKTKVEGRGAKKPTKSTAEATVTTATSSTPHAAPTTEDDPSTQQAASSTSNRVVKRSRAPAKPKPKRFIHPEYPHLGPRPKENTKARQKWEEKVLVASMEKNQIESEVKAQLGDEAQAEVSQNVFQQAPVHLTQSHLPKTNQMPGDSKGAGQLIANIEFASESKDETAYDARNLKGKAREIEAPTDAHQDPELTCLQATFLSLVGSGQITIEGAQQALQAVNELPLPAYCLPYSNPPQRSDSITQHQSISGGSAVSPPPAVAGHIHTYSSDSNPDLRSPKRKRFATGYSEVAKTHDDSNIDPYTTSTPRHRFMSGEARPPYTYVPGTPPSRSESPMIWQRPHASPPPMTPAAALDLEVAQLQTEAHNSGVPDSQSLSPKLNDQCNILDDYQDDGPAFVLPTSQAGASSPNSQYHSIPFSHLSLGPDIITINTAVSPPVALTSILSHSSLPPAVGLSGATQSESETLHNKPMSSLPSAEYSVKSKRAPSTETGVTPVAKSRMFAKGLRRPGTK